MPVAAGLFVEPTRKKNEKNGVSLHAARMAA
jgi:hypothetical protein